jgi:hypothetical protein
MSFTVYKDDAAVWIAASMEQAMALAGPYVRDDDIVRIEDQAPEGPPRIWTYDYSSAAWIELAG